MDPERFYPPARNERVFPVGKPHLRFREEKPMQNCLSLSHFRYYCKYYVAIVQKYRKRKLCGKPKRSVEDTLKDLCRKSGVELLEVNLRTEHILMYLIIPPKYSFGICDRVRQRKKRRANPAADFGNTAVTALHFWS